MRRSKEYIKGLYDMAINYAQRNNVSCWAAPFLLRRSTSKNTHWQY
jgi:hypothetical protein